MAECQTKLDVIAKFHANFDRNYFDICCSACNRTNMDLVFVVDSSGSIGAQSFENVRLFLKSMVNSFNIDPNTINVALVQFNENPRTEFHLKSYQTNAEVIGKLPKAI